MSDRDELALVRKMREQETLLKAENEALKHGGPGSTLPPMDAVDAKIAAAEARTDTKFAKVEGKLDLIVASLATISEKATDAKAEARTTRRYVVGTGISIAALMLAIAAFGVNAFTLGSRVDDIARIEAQQVVNQAAASRPSLIDGQRLLPAPAATPAKN